MQIRSLIPNIITAGNAFFGLLAIFAVFQNHFEWALCFFLLGVICDFFDGLAARFLGVTSELGVQLDSLADMITSGVLPGLLVYQWLRTQSDGYWEGVLPFFSEGGQFTLSQAGLMGLLLTMGAGYRLARFNIATDQKDAFIGLATPANALFFIGYPLLVKAVPLGPIKIFVSSPTVLMVWVVFFVYLMNSPLRMFKIQWTTQFDRVYLLLLLVGTVGLFVLMGVAAFSLSVIWYILLCLIRNVTSG